MRTTIRKAIFIWDYDKEEIWLNQMAAKGLCLVSAGFCRYEFESCEPGEYRICMQLLDNMPGHPESQRYIQFIEATGAEHVASFARWVYFRKRAAEGEFQLFSDNASRAKYLLRVIGLLAPLTAVNLIAGINNIFVAIALNGRVNGWLGLVNLALGILGTAGSVKLINRYRKMKREGRLFE